MPNGEHEVHFHNKPVKLYEESQEIDLSQFVYRLAAEYDDEPTLIQLLEQFINKIDSTQLDALIIGQWSEENEVGKSINEILDLLIKNANRLNHLKALFIGDMIPDECEISWIHQGDYSALLQAFPQLEELRIRGSNELKLMATEHLHLKKLIIESGGLPMEIIENIAQSIFPELTHLELWLGTDNYGFDGSIHQIKNVLFSDGFIETAPKLKTLALRDSEIADDIAIWLSEQSWITQLETLDLSLGNLSDKGAKALLESPYIRHLKTLDLSHHYISEEMQNQLQTLAASLSMKIILDDVQEVDEKYKDERYIAVSE